MKIFKLKIYTTQEKLPPDSLHVLVFHDDGIDRGARYGKVWRLADFSEDQLTGVTHWAEILNIDHNENTQL